MVTNLYLTLPSNASMQVHPDNTLAYYITDLPQRISLSGEWECGLAESTRKLGTTLEKTTPGPS